jgi:adenine deaminase
MDFVGVSRGNERMLGIIEAGAKAGKTIQGHAPAVVGRTLQAYMAAGVENDHELRGGAEALEKLRLGLLPFVKLGSHSNHLPAVMPELLTAKSTRCCCQSHYR